MIDSSHITGRSYDAMIVDDLAHTSTGSNYNWSHQYKWFHNYCKENTMPESDQRFIDISPEEYVELKKVAAREAIVDTFIKRVLEVITIDLEPDFGQNDAN